MRRKPRGTKRFISDIKLVALTPVKGTSNLYALVAPENPNYTRVGFLVSVTEQYFSQYLMPTWLTQVKTPAPTRYALYYDAKWYSVDSMGKFANLNQRCGGPKMEMKRAVEKFCKENGNEFIRS